MTTAVVVTMLALLAFGIVINQLFRLRKWLKNSSSGEAPDDDAAKPAGEI